MEWQPEPQGLNELLNLLRDAIAPNNRDQALVHKVIIIPKWGVFLFILNIINTCLIIIETSVIQRDSFI